MNCCENGPLFGGLGAKNFASYLGIYQYVQCKQSETTTDCLSHPQQLALPHQPDHHTSSNYIIQPAVYTLVKMAPTPWTDPEKQGALLDVLVSAANMPACFNQGQREQIVASLHARGYGDTTWNGLR